MCVLPPQSSYLLPKTLGNIMNNTNSILPNINNSFDFCGEPSYQRTVYNSRKKINQDRMQEIFEPRPSFSFRNVSNNIKQKPNCSFDF